MPDDAVPKLLVSWKICMLAMAFAWLSAGNRSLWSGEASPSSTPSVNVQAGPLRFAEQRLAQHYTYAYGLAVADLDGDGHLDITSSDAEPNSNLYLLRNDGAGSFQFSLIQKYTGGEDQPIRLERHAIGDLDRDGRPDVVIVDNLKSDIRWFANPGKKEISQPWQLHRVAAPQEIPGSYDVALDDFDADGDLDVAASSWVGNRFDWFENVGRPGNGSRWTRHLIEKDVGETRTIAVADFNRDGRPDLLGSARTGNLVVWYENSGQPATQSWKKHLIDSQTQAPMHGHPVDLDRDGDLDVIMAYGHGAPDIPASHQVAWYENAGQPGRGQEWRKHLVALAFPAGIEVVAGDLDGDRDLDLVATGWTTNGRIAWFENAGDPKADWKMHTIKEPWSKAITVVLADFDGDQRLDIVACAERGSNEVRWWRNLGSTNSK